MLSGESKIKCLQECKRFRPKNTIFTAKEALEIAYSDKEIVFHEFESIGI